MQNGKKSYLLPDINIVTKENFMTFTNRIRMSSFAEVFSQTFDIGAGWWEVMGEINCFPGGVRVRLISNGWKRGSGGYRSSCYSADIDVGLSRHLAAKRR